MNWLESFERHLAAFAVGGALGLLGCLGMGSGFLVALAYEGDHRALRALTQQLQNPAYGVRGCEIDKAGRVTCTYTIQGEIRQLPTKAPSP